MPPFTAVPDAIDGGAVLSDAARRRYRWPHGVFGFDATIECTDRGGERRCTVALTVDDAGVGVSGDLPCWAAADLAATAHGLQHHAEERLLPAEPMWAFALPDGTEVWVADEHDTRYVLRDGRIAEVHRRLADVAEQVTFEERTLMPDGRELPTRMAARHRTHADGSLCGAAVYRGEFAVVDDVVVPSRRDLICTTPQGDTTRSIVLHDHRVHRA
jgi:hypothetical protein